MNRFGRPQSRGASAHAPYSTRPSRPSNQTGLLGSAPSYPSGSGQRGSYQGNNSQEWRSTRSSGSLLGTPPAFSSPNAPGTSYQQDSLVISSEVRKLMQTLGLSLADVRKLSDLPENELSANRLAQIIGDLRKGKQSPGGGSQLSLLNSSNLNQSDSFRRGPRNSFGKEEKGLLGSFPGQQSHVSLRNPSDRRSDQDQPFSETGNRHRPTGIKVTVKAAKQPFGRPERMDSESSSGFGGRRQFARGDRNDDCYDNGRSGSADQYEQQRNDSFSQNNRRFNNRNINEHEADSQQNYEDERRADRGYQRNQNPRESSSRPVGTKNYPKPLASSLPSLMQLTPKPQKGLLGNPMRPNAQGLESLVAAIGGGSTSPSASLLTPLALATQTDPSVLEAQIQAMKAIQAEAIRLKQGFSFDQQRGGRNRLPAPRRRSPPPSRVSTIDKRLEREAKKEAKEMRAVQGRVIYIKYKSPRVLESDLKQLASGFGKVTNLLLIKPKIKNGHFQVFLELEQSDSAADMLEHYMANAPNIKGCPVDVKRSNYTDLKPRHEQIRGSKRSRSTSPIAEGSTQQPRKREKTVDEKPNLSITASDSNRKVAENKNKPVTDARNSEMKKTDKDFDVATDQDETTKADAEKLHEEIVDPLDAIADELALDEEFDLMQGVSYGGVKKKADKVAEDPEVKDEEKKNAIIDLERTDLDLDDVNVDENQAEDVATKLATAEHGDVKTEEVEEMEVKTDDNKKDQGPTSVDDPLNDNSIQADAVKDELKDSALGADKSNDSMEQEENASDDVASTQDSCVIKAEHGVEDSCKIENEDGIAEEQQSFEEDRADMVDQQSQEKPAAVQSVMDDTLKEVLAAKEHLEALTKVTRAKAALALAKKIKVCLEIAESLLDGSEAT